MRLKARSDGWSGGESARGSTMTGGNSLSGAASAGEQPACRTQSIGQDQRYQDSGASSNQMRHNRPETVAALHLSAQCGARRAVLSSLPMVQPWRQPWLGPCPRNPGSRPPLPSQVVRSGWPPAAGVKQPLFLVAVMSSRARANWSKVLLSSFPDVGRNQHHF